MKHEYLKRASAWDVVYSINMGIACWIAYAIMTRILISSTSRDDDLLGGMWAAVAAAFVFRDTQVHSLPAGIARFIATCVLASTTPAASRYRDWYRRGRHLQVGGLQDICRTSVRTW